MSGIIVFGSKYWGDCEPVKEYLSKHNIKYAYLDISENMTNLKRFLKYRDNYPQFEEIKKTGSVGVPCIVINRGEEILFGIKDLKFA